MQAEKGRILGYTLHLNIRPSQCRQKGSGILALFQSHEHMIRHHLFPRNHLPTHLIHHLFRA